MKINIILFVLVFAMNSGIETPNFKIVKKYKNFELRDYGSIVVATTSLERNYSRKRYSTFGKIR